MKKIICFLALISAVLTNASYAFALPKENVNCYPICFFDSLEGAVRHYKMITETTEPVLMPRWLPFEATSRYIRIVGCGTVLKAEYINGKQKVRVHVNPLIKTKLRNVISLSDKIKADYIETNLFYILRFDKDGRTYMIHLDKVSEREITKNGAIDYLTKISKSLAEVKG